MPASTKTSQYTVEFSTALREFAVYLIDSTDASVALAMANAIVMRFGTLYDETDIIDRVVFAIFSARLQSANTQQYTDTALYQLHTMIHDKIGTWGPAPTVSPSYHSTAPGDADVLFGIIANQASVTIALLDCQSPDVVSRHINCGWKTVATTLFRRLSANRQARAAPLLDTPFEQLSAENQRKDMVYFDVAKELQMGFFGDIAV